MHSPTVGDLLDRADAARAAGRGETSARLYDEAATRCRAEDDLDGWTEAVLGAASVYLFGAEPGKLPAQLYDVLARTTDDGTRARLAAALARYWAYAGQAGRAIQFADEAVDRAQRAGAPELVADCLDAALAAHWAPDELDVRRSLTTRLDDVAAHVLDPGARLQAHLWGLQVAMYPYLTERMLHQSAALAPLGEIAVQHRERLDGSGYPRGLSGGAISRPARVLGAADAYQSMREPRPHRPARPAGEAAAEMQAAGRAGRLDGAAVDAVLEAAGHRLPRRREAPSGLTAREVEVLILLARGMSNKQIAERLVITPKTAGNHVEHIYAKIDASNRAAAAMFAVQHGLLPEEKTAVAAAP